MSDQLTGDTPLTRFLAAQTLGQLRELRAEYRGEIEALRSRMAGLEAEMPLIDHAIAEKTGSRRKKTMSRSGGNHAQEGLRGHILSLMREQPELTWTKQDLYDALKRRGQAPGGQNPRNTLGSRLLEMARREEIAKVERGVYQHRNGGKASGSNRLFIGSATREAEGEGT